MTQPFIFVSTHKLKEGKWEEYRKVLQELVEVVESNEPRLIAFNVYFDEENYEVTGVQVHPDSDSMQFHLRVVSEHIQTAYGDYIDRTQSMQILGPLSEELLENMIQYSPPGTPVKVAQIHEVGFTRSNAPR